MLVADVLREELLSLSAASFAAARADEPRSVSDDPLFPLRVKVKPWPFFSTRHFSTMSLMSFGVV
jgi:hypothetical protein